MSQKEEILLYVKQKYLTEKKVPSIRSIDRKFGINLTVLYKMFPDGLREICVSAGVPPPEDRLKGVSEAIKARAQKTKSQGPSETELEVEKYVERVRKLEDKAKRSQGAIAAYSMEVVSRKYPAVWRKVVFLSRGDIDGAILEHAKRFSCYVEELKTGAITGQAPRDFQTYVVDMLTNFVNEGIKKKTAGTFKPDDIPSECPKCGARFLLFETLSEKEVWCPKCAKREQFFCDLCDAAMEAASGWLLTCSTCGRKKRFHSPLGPAIEEPRTGWGKVFGASILTHWKPSNPFLLDDLIHYCEERTEFQKRPTLPYRKLRTAGVRPREAAEIITDLLRIVDPQMLEHWRAILPRLSP